MATTQPFLPLMLTVVIYLFAALPCFAQTPKVVEWSKSPIRGNQEKIAANLRLFRQIEDVEIEDLLVAGRSITIGEPFAAPDDWLKSFTVRVKNISDQPLVMVQITLVLPEMGAGSPDVVFCYGCAEAQKVKGITAGEVVELKMLGGDFYDWVMSRAAEKGLSRINQAEIRTIWVTPPSGPVWFSGCIKTSNAKNACPAK